MKFTIWNDGPNREARGIVYGRGGVPYGSDMLTDYAHHEDPAQAELLAKNAAMRIIDQILGEPT